MKKTILFALMAILLTSCGRFSDGTSIWAEGLWIIPTLLFLGAAAFLITGYLSSKSGSNPYDASGKLRKDIETGNVPLVKLWQFKFAVVLIIAAIGVIIWQNLEK